MHLANGDIDVTYGQLPPGQEASVDTTVALMADMAKGKWGARSPKIRALAINIINAANVANKDYFGMAEAIHNYVRDNIRYVKDVVGQETLSYPEETLFNSRGGDCDDLSIAEIALLGSIGIRSYPVVIGLDPGRYSHVYVHIEIPPGRGRYAGQTIAADPIMREWPLGKAAPDDRVKMKKTYPHLAGLGAMALHGYARSPSYLSPIDEQEATEVPAVLKSRYVDTGSRGQIITTKRLTEWGDELDDMFNRAATISPMQAVPAFELYNRGPVTNRGEKILTSYLSQGRPDKRISAPLDRPMRRGPVIVNVRDRAPAAKKTRTAPTVGELLGLSDYLSDLAAIAKPAGQRHLVGGKSDPLHRAAAAAAHAKQRARKASGRVVRMQQGDGFLFGLGDLQRGKALDAAMQIEQLAHQISAKAQAVAKLCAGNSPIRQDTLRKDMGTLEHMDAHLGVIDAVTECDAANHPYQDAEDKVNTLTNVMLDRDFQAASLHRSRPTAEAVPVKPIVGVLPAGAVVRDQNGRVVFADNGSDDSVAGMGGFGSKLKKAVKKVASAPKTAVKKVHQQVKKAGSTVKAVTKNKRFRKLALGVATGGASWLTEKTIHKPLQKFMNKRKGGGGEESVDESVVTPTSTTVTDPTITDPSLIPQPGESTYDPGESNAEPIDESFGPEDMGPTSEAESATSDEQSGGGDGQSFTTTRDVEEGINPWENEGSAPSGDDASEGSAPAYEDEGEESFSEEPAAAPRRRSTRRSSEDLDDSPTDSYEEETEDSYEDEEPREESEEEIPSVDGLPSFAGASVGTLALVGVGLFLLLRKKK